LVLSLKQTQFNNSGRISMAQQFWWCGACSGVRTRIVTFSWNTVYMTSYSRLTSNRSMEAMAGVVISTPDILIKHQQTSRARNLGGLLNCWFSLTF
jgi:hypothetical protein